MHTFGVFVLVLLICCTSSAWELLNWPKMLHLMHCHIPTKQAAETVSCSGNRIQNWNLVFGIKLQNPGISILGIPVQNNVSVWIQFARQIWTVPLRNRSDPKIKNYAYLVLLYSFDFKCKCMTWFIFIFHERIVNWMSILSVGSSLHALIDQPWSAYRSNSLQVRVWMNILRPELSWWQEWTESPTTKEPHRLFQ